MACHIKTWWVIISVVVMSLTHTSMIFAAQVNASLAQHNPAFIQLGITQLGVPDEDAYVFCHEQDCQHRSIKHIHVAKVSEPLPLVMPEPAQEKLPELAAPTPLKPTTKAKKNRLQKTHTKSTVKCVAEK